MYEMTCLGIFSKPANEEDPNWTTEQVQAEGEVERLTYLCKQLM